MKKLSKKEGFVLVESLVAFSIVASCLWLFSISAQTLFETQQEKEQLILDLQVLDQAIIEQKYFASGGMIFDGKTITIQRGSTHEFIYKK